MKNRIVKSLVVAVGLCMVMGLSGCSGKSKTVEIVSESAAESMIESAADIVSEGAEAAGEETENQEEDITVPETEEVADKIVLQYPPHMQEKGYTNELIYEEMPQRVVSLTTYPVQALFEMGVMPIALPTTKVMVYPDSFKGDLLPGVMSENFDVEMIVALEPDLVFMPEATKDSYGTALEELNIPVYYVAMNATGMTSYEVVKEQTQAIVDGFAVDAEHKAKAEEVMNRFNEVENAVENFKKNTEGKTVFAITVSGTSIYINGSNNTLGSMLAMLGYENVYDDTAVGGHGMNELDMEVAIDYNPDVMVITGSSTKEDNKAMMDALYETNPEYWDSIPAYKEGRVVYLPSSYVSTAGMNIIDNIENLMIDMEGIK